MNKQLTVWITMLFAPTVAGSSNGGTQLLQDPSRPAPGLRHELSAHRVLARPRAASHCTSSSSGGEGNGATGHSTTEGALRQCARAQGRNTTEHPSRGAARTLRAGKTARTHRTTSTPGAPCRRAYPRARGTNCSTHLSARATRHGVEDHIAAEGGDRSEHGPRSMIVDARSRACDAGAAAFTS
ncbi:hypothetical protein OH77DRAFT_196678 [Trametes cingulata]|nr:hypothetical protein OH77DRAFT_196678 [Trametes cingulata]